MLQSEFGIDCDNTLAQQNVTDHHKYSDVLAEAAATTADYLSTLSVKAYLASIRPETYLPIITSIQGLV